MSALAKYWPTIRQVTYGLLAALLAIAAAAGWITDAQSEQWLQHAVTGLGAIGFIVAGLYVDRAPKATDIPPAVVFDPPVSAAPMSPLEQVIAEARRQLGR